MKALEVLADHLRSVVDPEIHDVQVLDAGPDKEACWPSLVVRTTGMWEFEPFDEDDIDSTATTHTVQVGDFSGRVELLLSAKSKGARATLGDRITAAFFAVSGKPGVLVLQLTDLEVSGITLPGPVPVAFRLGEDMWQEEMVFDRIRQHVLELDVEIPALVTRTDVYDINHLVTAFTEDLTSADPTYEQVEITDTGALEDYP
jgi:hypothetical protein